MQQYKLDSTALYAIYSSWEIAKNLEMEFLPKELLFTTLFIMPQAPMYNYFLSRGISEEEIEVKRTELFNKMIEDVDSISLVQIVISKKPMVIDAEIMKLFDTAIEIGKRSYDTDTIGIDQLTEAFSELYNDKFMLVMRAFIPTAGMKNTSPESEKLREKQTETFDLPSDLSSFLTVLNNNYSKDSTECHICGREEETEKLIRILMKKTKRNAVLVGEAGVGKSALVEKFTWMLVTGNCPKQLQNCIVLSLDVNSIVAGTKYRGTAEERFSKLIYFLENNPNCILFVDEIHLLLGAGACKEGDLDLANALKPMLARGATRVIGATTENEYELYFSKDSALKRRFERVNVREPRAYEVYDMIKNQIKLLEQTHNTTISKELVDSVIFKASCFNFETRNPDRTLDLLDKTMVCAELDERSEVTEQDILKNFNVNQKKFDKMDEKNKMATAYHEAGHYILHRFAKELTEYVMLAVSIIPAENYLGVNVFEIDTDITPSKNKEYYIELIASFLAGRIAEKMYSETLTAGASSDLEKATRIAKDVVTRYGLDETLTQDRIYLQDIPNPMVNDQLISTINEHIAQVLAESRQYATNLLTKYRAYLDALANALCEKGMLSSSEIDELFKQVELSN